MTDETNELGRTKFRVIEGGKPPVREAPDYEAIDLDLTKIAIAANLKPNKRNMGALEGPVGNHSISIERYSGPDFRSATFTLFHPPEDAGLTLEGFTIKEGGLVIGDQDFNHVEIQKGRTEPVVTRGQDAIAKVNLTLTETKQLLGILPDTS